MALELRVLGPLAVRGDGGDALTVSARKGRALIVYLALSAGGARAREQLAGLLWGDMGDERARHNLRDCLSRLRKDLGEGALTSQGDGLQLAASVDVDARRFEALAAGDDPEALAAALALYRGDLASDLVVAEDPFDSWLRGERERLRGLACDAMSRLAERWSAGGRLDDALGVVRQRLALDPACEEAHRQLMQLLARAGRRSDSLRQYDVCVEALSRELDTRPGDETTALYVRLKAASAPAAPPPPAARPVNPHAPLSLPDRPAIAVTPFSNLAGEGDEHLAVGVTEELITGLSRFGAIYVMAPASTLLHRDSPVAEIRADLGVHYVLRGSVHRPGARLRIAVQLWDAGSGACAWARRFDVDDAQRAGDARCDLFAVLEEVTETIVCTLVGRVEAATLERARRKRPESLDAYDCLLRGRELHHRYDPGACERAIALFQRAITIDPGFAQAHAWLGCAFGQKYMAFGGEPGLVRRAEEACLAALELDPDEGECHRILAAVYIVRRDFDRAAYHQRQAVFLNPGDDRTACQMGELLVCCGRAAEAEPWVRRAMRLNPYHPEAYWRHLGRALYHQGRHADAAGAFARMSRPRPGDRLYLLAARHAAGAGGGADDGAAQLTRAELCRLVPMRDQADLSDLADELARAGVVVD